MSRRFARLCAEQWGCSGSILYTVTSSLESREGVGRGEGLWLPQGSFLTLLLSTSTHVLGILRKMLVQF